MVRYSKERKDALRNWLWGHLIKPNGIVDLTKPVVNVLERKAENK